MDNRRVLSIVPLLFAFLFFTIVPPFLYSENQPSGIYVRTKTREILEDVTAFRFSEADKKIALLEEEAPARYYAAFAVAYRKYWTFLLSSSSEETAAGLQEAAERTIQLCKKEASDALPEAAIFESCSHFFMAMLRHRQKHHLASLVRLEQGMQTISRLSVNKEDDLAGDIRILQGCFRYYRNRSRWRQAVTELTKAAEDGFYFRAVALLMTAKIVDAEGDDVRRALGIYESLTEKYPRNSLFLFFAAKCNQRLEMYEESLSGYRKSLESIRYRPVPLELLCRIHFSAGQIFEYHLVNLLKAAREYEKAYQWAAQSVPETRWFIPWSTYHLGQVHAKMGRKKEALEYLHTIRRQDDPQAHMKAQKLIKRLTDRNGS